MPDQNSQPSALSPTFIAEAYCESCEIGMYSDMAGMTELEAIYIMVSNHRTDTSGKVRCDFVPNTDPKEGNTTVTQTEDVDREIHGLRKKYPAPLRVVPKLVESNRKLDYFARGRCSICSNLATSDAPLDSAGGALRSLQHAHAQEHGHWFKPDDDGVSYDRVEDSRTFMVERLKQLKRPNRVIQGA